MFWKPSARSKIKKILLVSLSNLGDVVLTFPVFDRLRETFPEAEISVIVGPKAKSLLNHNPHVFQTLVYDKSMSSREKLGWVAGLRKQRFDLVVDLRNSMLPLLVGRKYATPPVMVPSRCHMKDKHLGHLRSVLPETADPVEKYAGFQILQTAKAAEQLVYGLKDFVLFAPGAADDRKRWTPEGFSAVMQYVISTGRKIVVVGDKRDRPLSERVLKDLPGGIVNLCGFTSLTELSGVIRRAGAAITNDSGIMHLCSYFDVPTVALFGPTDPFFYGPWGRESRVVRKGQTMAEISPRDVIAAFNQLREVPSC